MQKNMAANVPARTADRTATSLKQDFTHLSGKGNALRVSAYLRYSTDGQKETSIDDQERTCTETATRHGLTLSKCLVFADNAMTGSAKGTHKREQYHALRESIRAGEIDVIICDQTCRLARSAKEALTFFEELKAHNVRLLTADGFDSEQPTAQLLFGIKSVFSEFFLDETRHRVRRGMMGEFGRGSMVTAVPFGYQVDALTSAKTGQCQWAIHPEESEIVKEVFSCRKQGMSLNQIAAILNGRRVATPRDEDKKKGLFWRASAIWRLLKNPLYKGIYSVNFGGEKPVDRTQEQRLMSELALVSIDDWDACQKQGTRSPSATVGIVSEGSRGTYFGGKHPLAGVLRCGVCGVPLSCHHAKSDGGSMHCIQCEHATRAGIPGRQPLYVSVKGVRKMLHWLLQRVIASEAIARYRARLQERLAGGQELEMATTRQALEKAERSQGRFARLLQQIDSEDPVLEQQYFKSREDVLHLTKKAHELEEGLRRVNQDVIRQQLDIDLCVVVDAFLADNQAPGRTRTLLNSIFPSIVLKGKTNRYTAIFEVHVKPGAILAQASETAELIHGSEVMWVRLQTSGSKNPVWTVEEIATPDFCLEETSQAEIDCLGVS